MESRYSLVPLKEGFQTFFEQMDNLTNADKDEIYFQLKKDYQSFLSKNEIKEYYPQSLLEIANNKFLHDESHFDEFIQGYQFYKEFSNYENDLWFLFPSINLSQAEFQYLFSHSTTMKDIDYNEILIHSLDFLNDIDFNWMNFTIPKNLEKKLISDFKNCFSKLNSNNEFDNLLENENQTLLIKRKL